MLETVTQNHLQLNMRSQATAKDPTTFKGRLVLCIFFLLISQSIFMLLAFVCVSLPYSFTSQFLSSTRLRIESSVLSLIAHKIS